MIRLTEEEGVVARKFSEEREIQIRLAIINNSTSRSLQPFMNFQAVVHLRASTHFSCVRPRASFLTFAARLLKKTGEKGQDGCGTARVRGRKTSTRRASETPHSPRWKTGRNRKKRNLARWRALLAVRLLRCFQRGRELITWTWCERVRVRVGVSWGGNACDHYET